MLRKFGNIMTMCLLLISTTGFAVSEHFCGTDLVSIELNKEAEPCCDNAMCCHSETQFYQLDEDFMFTATSYDFETLTVTDLPQLAVHPQFDLTRIDAAQALCIDFESPPPPERKVILSTLQIYIL